MNRRNFVKTGLSAAGLILAAPAIVRASSLMPIKPLPIKPLPIWVLPKVLSVPTYDAMRSVVLAEDPSVVLVRVEEDGLVWVRDRNSVMEPKYSAWVNLSLYQRRYFQ